jgi:thiamine pyrophosphate-dependent acetolactate synthase large subunit-like protein
MNLGKFHSVTVPVWGEIGVTLEILLERLKGKMSATDQTTEVAQRWHIWREEKTGRLRDDRGHGVNSAAIFASMTRFVPEDAVMAVDVGNNTYSFGRYFECRSQSVLMSGYLGSIGFGYPAAMGAWAAAPGRAIFAVTGDGGFGQYAMELTTAVKYSMPIKHVLLNNSELGKISKEQRAGRWDVWQTALHNPNFARFADNCGARGIRVTKLSELDDAMQRLVEHKGPAVLEIISDPELI